MEVIITIFKLVIYFIVSFSSIFVFIDFLTAWGKKKERKKLLIVTLIIWLLVIGLLNLILRI